VIPGGIPFLRWIPCPEAGNSRRNNLLTVHVYSFCEKEIFIFMISSTFLMQISLMCGILSYFVQLPGTFLMPNYSIVRRNKKFFRSVTIPGTLILKDLYRVKLIFQNLHMKSSLKWKIILIRTNYELQIYPIWNNKKDTLFSWDYPFKCLSKPFHYIFPYP
jgi:hypothetical protein